MLRSVGPLSALLEGIVTEHIVDERSTFVLLDRDIGKQPIVRLKF